MITEQHQALVLQLTGSFKQRADELKLASRNDDMLREEIYFSRAKLAKGFNVDVTETDITLPKVRFVLVIENYTLLITAIDFNSDNFENDYDSTIWWSALIRSNLEQGSEDDLHLILVGPPDSGKDEHSRFCAEWIEQDERFCRKMVWLPISDPAEDYGAQRGFIDRTFLARPWLNTNGQTQAELDAVSSFLKRTSHPNIDSETIASWLNIAGRGDQTGRDLVISLLNELNVKEIK